jgi:hypothetical protein
MIQDAVDATLIDLELEAAWSIYGILHEVGLTCIACMDLTYTLQTVHNLTRSFLAEYMAKRPGR